MNRRAREIGLLAAVLVIAALAYTLFSTPSLSVEGDNYYVSAMQSLGLSDPTGRAEGGAVVERFRYERYDLFSLAGLSAPSKAYAAAVVRLLTQPFGLDFDTRYLAAVYMAVMALGAWLTARGLYRHSRLAAYTVCGLLPLLCTFTPVICYLNSLYDTGAVAAFSVLYMGAVTYCLCRDRGCGLRPAVGAFFAALLLLRSQGQMIALAPFVLAVCVLCAWHACPRTHGRLAHLVCCGLLLLYCGQGVASGLLADPDIVSDAADYRAVFQGYLPASEDVKADIKALGLPADIAGDVGRSYYDDEDSFVHDPYDEAEREPLMEKITLPRRLAYCLRHPGVVVRIIRDAYQHFYDAFNDRMITSDGQMRFVRPSPLVLIQLLVPMDGSGRLLLYMAVAALLCLLGVFTAPKRTGLVKLSVSMSLVMLGMACYLPVGVAMSGGTDMRVLKVQLFFFAWIGFFVMAAAALCLGDRLLRWLAARDAALRGASAPAEPVRRPRTVSVSRRSLLAVCAVVCVAVGVLTLGPEDHIGGVNNGDFGRMMEQLGIAWPEDMQNDIAAQTVTRVVEDYDYSSDVPLSHLSPVDPSYSLIYPSMLVRLWSAVTGRPFSTYVLAVILLAVTIACILLMVRDLYTLLGKWAALPAACLIAMLLGENYVAWYNALFGESMLSVGLVMTLACALHLIVMERGGRRSWLWLVLLGISVRLAAGSKAQMTLALPGGLALLVGLAFYHHPLKRMKKTRLAATAAVVVLLAGVISWDTLGIYRKNAGVSERQTLWQSVFYGLLMVSDDPDAAMEELGIDPAMKADIGKHAYYPDDEYVYPLFSKEADEAFYDHVSTMTVVGYYLRHPVAFIRMLDRAARESVHLSTSFMAYTDEMYDQHTALYGFTLWMHLRPLFACRAFWQYVVLYGAAALLALRKLCRRDTPGRVRMLALLFLSVMAMGVLQYPLSVVGNGFADNNKQLYGFMLCHDLLVVFAVTLAAYRFGRKKDAVLAKGGSPE